MCLKWPFVGGEGGAAHCHLFKFSLFTTMTLVTLTDVIMRSFVIVVVVFTRFAVAFTDKLKEEAEAFLV